MQDQQMPAAAVTCLADRLAGQPDGGVDIDALHRILNACFHVANVYHHMLTLDAKVPLDDFKSSIASRPTQLHSSAVASIAKANEYFSGDGLTADEKTLETLVPAGAWGWHTWDALGL